MKEFYKEVPILVLKDIVPLPDQELTIEVKRERSKAVAQLMRVKLSCLEEGLDSVSTDDLYVGLFMQKDPAVADPAPNEVFDIGGIGRVLRVYKNDNDNMVMRVRVLDRGKRLSMESS
ncbi:MAG: LON peptidase substrate-binding domain-containing protein, partial [Lachnospiraceae bacterium]|nr:LON peptidase substrate-binding domain-containing protein [Lachnospiraceae bacterium]